VKVTNEKTENSQVFLTIEMEPAEMEESLESSYRRLVKTVDVPGFRKGKASRAILERHVGQESLLRDAVDELVPQSYQKALEQQGIEPFTPPQIEVVQTDPLVFKAVVSLKPVIKLGDYHSIRDAPEPVEVTEDDINAVIEQLRHQHATWEPVERPVDFSDLVTLYIDSNVEDEPFINQKGAQYQVIRDSSSPAPGFAEQLQGMNKDEEKEFKLQFPSDYTRSELAEKEASFKVKVTEIKQEDLPELTDELAVQIDPDLKTVDSLRERISKDLGLTREENTRRDFGERIIETAVDLSEVEFPPILVEMEVDRSLERNIQLLQRSGQGLEQYLQNINKTEEELREELRPAATKRVARSLVLGKIAEEEKIEVSDSEIEAEIEEATKSVTENKDELEKALSTPQARQSIEKQLVTRKTIQRMTEIAQDSKETQSIEKEEEK